jgi:hypothetical protein
VARDLSVRPYACDACGQPPEEASSASSKRLRLVTFYRTEIRKIGGATGIRTLDLLHAISRQHIRPRPSTQVTVPGRAYESCGIRASCGISCCTALSPCRCALRPARDQSNPFGFTALAARNHARHRHRKASKSSCNGWGANGRRPLRSSHRPVDSARTSARRTPAGACRRPLNARRGPR